MSVIGLVSTVIFRELAFVAWCLIQAMGRRSVVGMSFIAVLAPVVAIPLAGRFR
jgi:hypothetical protein